MKKHLFSLFLIVPVVIVFLTACSSNYKPTAKNEVIVHALADPEMLNPLCYTDAQAGYMMKHIFQPLMDIDFKTLKLVPILAEGQPVVEKAADGKGLIITFQIRKEAVWDNGSPVTAKDVLFTLKALKNPKVNNHHIKPYFEFIADIKLYENDPKKLTIISNEVYMLAEYVAADFHILPEYFYDPKGLMAKFSIKQLGEEKDKLMNDPDIIAFADDFNSEKRAREKDHISGSGAYKFAEWTTGQRVVFERKKDWWGDKLNKDNVFLEANPDKIIYQTVNDQTTAIVALKAGNMDVMYSIKAKDFMDLKGSEKFNKEFNLHTPITLTYTYLGINMRKAKFQDVRVRKAIAHLVDVDKIIKTVQYGLAQRVVGPIHPSKKEDYNSDITLYDFNPEKAKQLLTEAGWKDNNGNGTLDKVIDGQLQEFTIDFNINAGNEARKQSALLFQEEARKVGIQVNILSQDWAVYIENNKKHNFEMNYGAWVNSTTPWDPKQVFHSTSATNEGSNYCGFGNAQSDALIDSIRVELDGSKRALLYKRLQQLLHDEVPFVFMFAPSERMAINKKFTNAEPSVQRPGFWPQGFQLAAEVK